MVTAPAHHRRIAAGILSWGQDMDQETLPFQCNLGYQVPRRKQSDYVGTAALEAARRAIDAGSPPFRNVLVGMVFGGRPVTDYAGRAQIAPAADINLHFNGDLHAVSTANNLLAAVLDNHVHWDNELDIDPATISWSRVMDLNDRALREIDLHLRGDARRAGGFDITAASEVMAVLCLARDHADLGAEKFLDIKCRQSGLRPDAVVLVCTARALKMHAGVARSDLAEPNADAVRAGAPNLARHIGNLRRFGATPVVAANRFATDTVEELSAIEAVARDHGVRCVVANHWAEGGAGATVLARMVLEHVERPARVELLYPDDMPLREKTETVARLIHGAGEVSFGTSAARRLEEFERLGYGRAGLHRQDPVQLLHRPEGPRRARGTRAAVDLLQQTEVVGIRLDNGGDRSGDRPRLHRGAPGGLCRRGELRCPGPHGRAPAPHPIAPAAGTGLRAPEALSRPGRDVRRRALPHQPPRKETS